MGHYCSEQIACLLLLALFFMSPDCLSQENGATKESAGKTKQQSRKHKKGYSKPVKPIEDKTYSPKPVLLTGGVRHSESLPPVQSKLNVGATYDEKKLEKPPPSRDWYKLPNWLAGTWESDKQTTISTQDYITGKSSPGTTVANHGIADYGKQRDHSGGTWDYLYAPQEVQSESDQTINKDLTTKQVLLNNSDSLVVIKDVFTRRKIDKTSNKILEITQMEQISSISPEGKDKIKLAGSLKVFGRDGRKLGLIVATVLYKRTKPFVQINYDKRTHEDLRPSFNSFLESHGMAKLLPIKK